MENIPFSSLGLSPEILKAVEKQGFEQASPIQAAAIPILMSGKDVVGQSQTGSGKTAAFSIPAIEKIDSNNRAVQMLVVCPTRELATQVADEVHKLIVFKKGLSAVPIYGGASYERQFYELKKGVQIVIGTPGRIIDHLDRGTLLLDQVTTVVLDEADRMLDMGFREDIERILSSVPKERQTVFFSATMSPPIRELIKRYSRDPEMVKIEQKQVDAPAIEQWFYEVHSRMKLEALIRLIDYHGYKLGIIFCNTQRMVDELADTLIAQGYSADRLHGGIAQAQRTRVMNKFKKAEFEFLVATDVAARGIDVDDLELVVNYDLPYDAEDYVHRIGRTGRAGKSGMALTFVSGRDIYKLQFIERYTKAKIRRGKVPTSSEVEEKRADVLLERVRSVIDAEEFKAHAPLVDRLLEEGKSSTDIAAALFQLLVAGGGEAAARPAGSDLAPMREDGPPRRDYDDRPRRNQDDRPARRDDRPARSFEDRPARPVREDRPARPFEDRPKVYEDRPRGDRPESSPDQPALRRPPPGMKWVCLSVGRTHDAGPRDVVDLIASKTGLPGRNVGMINISQNQSFAQIPESYAEKLKEARGSAIWQDVNVDVWAWHNAGPPRTGGKKKERR